MLKQASSRCASFTSIVGCTGTLTFVQIARGMVLPLTIIVSSFNTKSWPTIQVIGAASLVTVGFLVGVAPPSLSSLSFTISPSSSGHTAPSLLSLFYGLLSSLFIAFHSVLIKSSLPHCGGSTIQLAYWTNLGSALFLIPFVLFNGELGTVMRLATDEASHWQGSVFVWGSAVTGVFGFLLCVAGLLSIKVTSPITHMFSSVSDYVLLSFSRHISLVPFAWIPISVSFWEPTG